MLPVFKTMQTQTKTSRSKNSFTNSTVLYLLILVGTFLGPFFFLKSELFFERAEAQEESINLQGFYFSDAFRYAYLEDSGILRFPRPFVLTTSISYISTPLVVSDPSSENKISDYLDHFWLGTIGFTYYLNSIFSVGFDLNYLRTTYADVSLLGYGYTGNQGATISGLGDTTIRGKIRLFRDVKEKLGIAFVPKIELATGKPEGFSTDDSMRFTGILVLEKYWERLGFLISAGYSTSSSAVYQDVDYRSLIPVGLGLTWKLDPTWNINFEGVRNVALRGGSKQDAGDYYATVKGKLFKYASFYSGFGIAGVSEVDQDNWTLFAGLKFSGESKDSAEVIDQNEPIAPPVIDEDVLPPPVIVKRDQEKLLGTLFKTDRAYFDNGRSNIKNSEAKKLNEVADQLIQNQSTISRVIIEGYASKVGPKALNAQLSADRAENVFQYLERRGVSRKVMQTVSYGDDYLNEEPEHWMNRRVEFRVYMKTNNN